MRPRGSPRGIRVGGRGGIPIRLCFNEAAGKSPRNRRAGNHDSRRPVASMRPRGSPRGIDPYVYTYADNSLASMRPRGSPRGIPQRPHDQAIRDRRFNEAAGKSPRNPRPAFLRVCVNEAASMRPRGSPRGIGRECWIGCDLASASMRPRGSPRGIGSSRRRPERQRISLQ